MLVVVGLVLYAYLGWYVPLTAPFTHDYAINWAGARLLLKGENLYSREAGEAEAKAAGSVAPDDTFFYTDTFNSFIQPPIGAIAALPFADLSWPAAKLGWLALNHVATWLALLLLWSAAGWPRWWPESTALLLGTCRPLHICFYYGQADGLILLALALGLWCLGRLGGARGAAGAALALGAAATWKLSPVLLGLGLLKGRRLRLAVEFGAATVAALALQFLVAGPESTRTFFADVLPQLLGGSYHYVNVSLPGWVVRLWAGPDEAYSSASAPSLPLPWRLLQLGLTVAVLGAALWLSPRRIDRRDWPGVAALWLTAGVLVAAVAWEHYQAWAIVGVPWALGLILGGTPPSHKPLRFGHWFSPPVLCLLAAWVLLDIPLEWLSLEARTYVPIKAAAGLFLLAGFAGLLASTPAQSERSGNAST